jgi:hypothetical protein
LEAKRQELDLFIAIGVKPEGADRRDWLASTKRSFDSYVSLLWGVEPEEHSKEEKKLLDYYTNVVKKSTVLARKTNDGKIEVAGDLIEFLKKDV